MHHNGLEGRGSHTGFANHPLKHRVSIIRGRCAGFHINREYKSEITIKYQKRFQKHRDALFTFLTLDSIPWNNNMAERAIRHLAVQRKLSGSFFKNGAVTYLILLSIGQTCRFQNKSFLKFLLSGENDVDDFKSGRKTKAMMVID